jgi:hypothetical protein
MPITERRFHILATALAIALAGMPALAAETPPPETEAAKAEIVARVLEGREFELFSQRDSAVCFPLLDALRAGGAAVAFVEPIVRAERYHDQALLFYREMCPGMEFNRHSYGGGHPIYDDLSDLPEQVQYEIMEAIGHHSFGTRDFKLYRLDPADDLAGGPKYLFYVDDYYSRDDLPPYHLPYEEIPRSMDWNHIVHPEDVAADLAASQPLYKILDLNRCEYGQTIFVPDRIDPDIDWPPDNHNAVIRLGDHLYILEIEESEPGKQPRGQAPYWVTFHRIENGRNTFGCSFVERK